MRLIVGIFCRGYPATLHYFPVHRIRCKIKVARPRYCAADHFDLPELGRSDQM